MSDLPDYIFGIGPGRCGTKSLAALLSACDGIEAQHEGAHIRWGNATGWPIEELPGEPKTATGYQWVWPAIYALRQGWDVRVVGLVRYKYDFVDSASETLDTSVFQGGREAQRFPDCAGWASYWDVYTQLMANMLAQHPDAVTLLPTAALNDPQRVLDACGVPRDRQTDQVSHLNRRDE